MLDLTNKKAVAIHREWLKTQYKLVVCRNDKDYTTYLLGNDKERAKSEGDRLTEKAIEFYGGAVKCQFNEPTA